MAIYKSLADRSNIRWAALIVVFLIFFSTTLFYPDTMATNGHALLLLDCIADGRFFDFYTESAAYANNTWGFPANYLLPIYVIFAIWDLPIWLLIQIGVLGEMPVAGVIWSKFLVAAAWVGCVVFVYRLLSDSGNAKKGFWTFFLCSSPIFFLTPTSGFYDSIELFFGLWGFYRIFKDNRLSIGTLFIFSLSISVKLVLLFPIFLWVLVFEKRFLYLLRDVAILASVSIVSVALFYPSFFQVAGPRSEALLEERFLSLTFSADIYPCSVFFLGFFVLCIFAYCIRKPATNDAFVGEMGWMSVAYFFIFIICLQPVQSQWTTLAIPFIALLMSSNNASRRLNIIAITIWEIALLVILSMRFDVVFFAPSLFDHMALSHLGHLDLFTQETVTLKVIFEHFGLIKYMPAVMALFIASSGFLLINNLPPSWVKSRKLLDPDDLHAPSMSFELRTELVRVGILAVIYIGYILCAFII